MPAVIEGGAHPDRVRRPGGLEPDDVYELINCSCRAPLLDVARAKGLRAGRAG
jgi:hypothetical protein